MGLAAGTAFVFGFHVPRHRTTEAAERALFAPNAFIRIDRQGNVTLIMPQVEMGQGTYTSISMILAEELDADWNRVRTEHAPPDEKNYANPELSIQATGNSNSVRAWWKPLRQAAANTRACFVAAAARQWGVTPEECRTENSTVIHDRTGRTLRCRPSSSGRGCARRVFGKGRLQRRWVMSARRCDPVVPPARSSARRLRCRSSRTPAWSP